MLIGGKIQIQIRDFSRIPRQPFTVKAVCSYVLPSEKKGWKAMATNSSGIARSIPKSQCIPWIIVLIIESLSVVILNLLMVIVFAKHRQLQRRVTYLLIRNLAIVDLLAGGISGPLQIDRFGGL